MNKAVMNITKKVVATVVALSFAGAAAADQFYIDVGADFGGNGINNPTAVDATTTGWLDQLSIAYQSTSTLTDAGSYGVADGILSAGDKIVSSGGISNNLFTGLADISSNLVNNFEPAASTFGGPSDNGFGTGAWGLTFGFTDLTGTFNGSGFNYTSGTVSMYYYDATMTDLTDFVRLFDLEVSGGGDIGNATVLAGTLTNFGTGTVNGVDAGDVFATHLGTFEDYATLPNNSVHFTASQDTQPTSGLGYNNGVANISGTHNGSINFAVPEPTTLAILGLGLLGMAGASRRKAK